MRLQGVERIARRLRACGDNDAADAVVLLAEELAETREKLDSLIVLMDPVWRAHKRDLEGVR